jgi:hypothetical protein
MFVPPITMKKEKVCYSETLVHMFSTKLHKITTKATIELKKDYSFVSCNELCKPEQ